MTVCYDLTAKHPNFYKEPEEALTAAIWLRNSRCEAEYHLCRDDAKDYIRQLKKYGFKVVRDSKTK